MAKRRYYPSQEQTEITDDQRAKDVENALDSVVHKLTAKQRQFTIYYLTYSNASEAAGIAGYANPDKQGSRLLQNPKIQAVIDEYFHAAEMSAQEVIARLSEQARGEYGRYFYIDGTIIALDIQRLLDEGKGHLIKNVGWAGKDANRQTVEFYDAHAALVDLARINGKFKDNLDVTTKGKEVKPGADAAALAALLDEARTELAGWKPPNAETAEEEE